MNNTNNRNLDYEDSRNTLHSNPKKPKRSRARLSISIAAMLALIPLCMSACNIKDSGKPSSGDSQVISDNGSSSPSSFDVGALKPDDPLNGLSSGDSNTNISDGTSTGASADTSTGTSAASSKDPENQTGPDKNPNVTNKIGEYKSSEKSEKLRLVNFYNRLPSNFEPHTTKLDGGKSFSTTAADSLQRMIDDCNKAVGGTKLWAQSTYRSYKKQTKLYNNETQRWIDRGMSRSDAEEKAATIVAIPGSSEHNTGLCCDFNTITEDFANTKMYDWLMEHCHEYGFIQRYPKDKQDITGIIWEPWHYRYVGVEAATEIMNNGWCLEEYHYYKGL